MGGAGQLYGSDRSTRGLLTLAALLAASLLCSLTSAPRSAQRQANELLRIEGARLFAGVARPPHSPPRWQSALPLDKASRPSIGCGGNGSLPAPDPQFPDWYKISIDDPVQGHMERWYTVHIPQQYDPSIPTPLVLDIHGYTSNAIEQKERTWLDKVADEENFIVVYPDGYDDVSDAANNCYDRS
jgi:hypothetical protein